MDTRPLPDDFRADTLLRSNMLSLHPLQERDRTALSSAAADPEIWAGHPSKDRWKPEIFAGYFDFLLQAGGTMVARDIQGEVIGLSRYYCSADAPDGIGIGFTFLARKHWGGHMNFEMKRLMVDHIFATRPEVWFHIAPTNIRSQKATAKLGAVQVEDRHLDLGTGPTDWVRMVLLRDAWSETCAARA